MWEAATNNKGYGTIGAVAPSRRTCLAHRVAWELAHGRPVPDGMCVCHRCDNPLCVNPAHLFLGTQADNLRDMQTKGRGAAPKLSDEDIREICALSESDVETARRYDVTASAIWHLRNGGRGKRVAGSVASPPPRGHHSRGRLNKQSKLDASKVREIRRMIGDGRRYADIAEYFSVSLAAIGFVATGRTWGHIT